MKAAVFWMSAALVSSPAAAFAQQGLVAPREGNIWGGVAHEPSAPSVNNAERNAGVALPQGQAQKENQEVERLEQQLTGHSSNGQSSSGQGASGTAPGGQAPP